MLKSGDSTRLKYKLREWRITAQPPLYGLGAVLLLWLFLAATTFFVVGTHEVLFQGTFAAYWYYDPVVSLSVVVFVIFIHRARLLGISRWRPRWMDFIVGGTVGILLPSILWLAVRDPARSLGFKVMPERSIVPIVFLGPILEELFFRATCLKSFEGYMPKIPAILLCAFLVALGHHNSWVAFPQQVALSIIYVTLGDSLPASIAAHITSNAVVLLLPMFALEKWHAQFWSLWK